MTAVRFCEPPPPPEGQRWCVMCLMLAKHAITEKAGPDRLIALARDGKKGVHWVPWDRDGFLLPAYCRGFTEMPQLGIVDVCWTHLAGGVGEASSLLIPPGLHRGRG
jgi:hypothetical protein